MKIGDFAKVCGVPLSLLRYYDRLGLLRPVHTDRFTGYRHYDESQVSLCGRIGELKAAGFSLAEIRRLITGEVSSAETEALFEAKRRQLGETLRRLNEMQESWTGGFCMQKTVIHPPREAVNLPFVDDERVVGRWEILGEYENAEAFRAGRPPKEPALGDRARCLYFLPGGEAYWCYSWTRGKLVVDDGECASASDYTLEEVDGERFMFVDYRGYDSLQTGKTTLVVLRQRDRRAYTADEIARRDEIQMPFVPDDRVVGRWRSAGMLGSGEEFSVEALEPEREWFFRGIEFFADGGCVSRYGDEVISGRERQEWTKGFWLRKWNHTACAYELREAEGRVYMILEWKSGDYRWGGFETDYYVLVREE